MQLVRKNSEEQPMSFESFLQQDKSAPRGRRRITYTLSIALHVVLLTVGAIHSFWHVDELTPPVVKVTFLTGATPPPPPPPPPRKKSMATKVKKPDQIVQPKPTQIIQPKVEEQPEEEEDEGVEGGVEGGVAGGVVGGMVGAPPTATATLLPPRVGAGQLISDVLHDSRYTPSLPPQLNRAGMVVWGLFKICVSIEGKVTEVKIVKGADPLVDGPWIEKIRTWQYRPYSINGRPVPYCYPMRLEVRSSN
jgi:protein TonB